MQTMNLLRLVRSFLRNHSQQCQVNTWVTADGTVRFHTDSQKQTERVLDEVIAFLSWACPGMPISKENPGDPVWYQDETWHSGIFIGSHGTCAWRLGPYTMINVSAVVYDD